MHMQCARSHSLCSWPAIAQRQAERGYTSLLHACRNTDRAIACLYRPKDLEFVGRTDSAAALQLTFRLSSAHPAAQSDLLHLLVLDLELHVLLSSCRLVQLDDAMRSLAAAAGEASAATARARRGRRRARRDRGLRGRHPPAPGPPGCALDGS